MNEPQADDATFMFAFAHDLRAHLRTMQTRVQLVQRAAKDSLGEQESLWLEEAVAAGENMGRLIGAVASYYAVSPAADTMPLGLLLRGLQIEMKKALTDAGAELTSTAVEAEVSRGLAVVLRELVGNSCKFRPTGIATVIRIEARMAGPDTLEVTVTDNGSGVGPEFVETIFEPFRRLNPAHDFPGFGLGLPLCRRILEANRGSIEAIRPPDGGLCQRILMPARLLPQ